MEGAKGKCMLVQAEAVKMEKGREHVSSVSMRQVRRAAPEESAGCPVRLGSGMETM